LQEHLTQRWPDTSILTRAPRQSRSDRRHSAAPLTGLTEGQRRLHHSDCSATRQSESDRQSDLARGAIGNSAPPDPRARTRAKTRKTANSAPPDTRARTRAKTRKTANSAPPDPRARTQAKARKTANSAPPDPGLGLGLSPRRRRTPLRPTPGLGLRPGLCRTISASPDPGARARPRPRKTDSTSASEEPPRRPT
jgi:hypothetical protein